MGSIPESGRSPRVGNGNPLHWKIPWIEELAGSSPWGCKESDMTEYHHGSISNSTNIYLAPNMCHTLLLESAKVR